MRALQMPEPTVFVGLQLGRCWTPAAAASNSASNRYEPRQPGTTPHTPRRMLACPATGDFSDAVPICSRRCGLDATSESLVVLLTPEQAAEARGIGRWKLYDVLRQSRTDLAPLVG